MDTRVKFVLSCCMFMFISPLFAAATKQSAASREIEAEKYLAKVNKPFVKSIKSPDGDIIDCVLIADQPAFDNPLFKSHNIRMRPSSYYPDEASENVTRSKKKLQLWQLAGSCPEGTIPIRRTRKEDVLRASSIERYGQKAVDGYIHEHAIGEEFGSEYFGAKGFLNIWQPFVERPTEFSLTQVWVVARDAYSSNSIEAGWQVYPHLYHDSQPRLFIYFTNNSYKAHSGCYNLQCSGFHQTNDKIAIGGTLKHVSSYMGEQFTLPIEIWQDPVNDDWWLKVDHVEVGYWPASILPLLSGGASMVQWGGEVAYKTINGHTTTDMGSGNFAEAGFRKASYVRNIALVHANGKWGPPGNLRNITTEPTCYNIKVDTGVHWGKHIYYGGPGYNTGCR